MKQKIQHIEFCKKMEQDGWKVIEVPGTFDSGKFGIVNTTFRYWSKVDPENGVENRIPFFGFI